MKTVFEGRAALTTVLLGFGPDPGLQMRACTYVPFRGGPRFPVILIMEPIWEEAFHPLVRTWVARGYSVAGLDHLALDRDDADRSDGAHPLYPGYDWSTLSVWAWGAMRAVDYLLGLRTVDPEKIALFGHSRRGKAALLAGAMDERIALTVPHGSGAGGAGSFRILGPQAESLDAITDPNRFGYWFHPRLREFAGRESHLPFDQHFLKALVAPRAILSLEAKGDLWANPLGAQEIHRAVEPVYQLLGAEDRLAIHFHEGGHDVVEEDWLALTDYADHLFFGKAPQRTFNRLPFEKDPEA